MTQIYMFVDRMTLSLLTVFCLVALRVTVGFNMYTLQHGFGALFTCLGVLLCLD